MAMSDKLSLEHIGVLKANGQPGKFAMHIITKEDKESMARMVARTHVNLSNTDLQIKNLEERKRELKAVFRVVDELCPDWRDYIENPS